MTKSAKNSCATITPRGNLKVFRSERIRTFLANGGGFTVRSNSPALPHSCFFNYIINCQRSKRKPGFLGPGLKTKRIKNSAHKGKFSIIFVLYVIKHRYYLLQTTTALPQGLTSFLEAQAVVITAETTKTASRMYFISP